MTDRLLELAERAALALSAALILFGLALAFSYGPSPTTPPPVMPHPGEINDVRSNH